MCRKAVESARQTATGEIEIWVYLDLDDPKVKDYDMDANIVIGEPLHSGKAIKVLAKKATGDLIFFGSDDFTWKTRGWDEIFRKHMPHHGLSVLFPEDTHDGCSPCFTRKWMEVTGLFPDYFEHFGPDTWVADTAKRAGQLIKVPVLIEHRKVKDALYARARSFGDSEFAKRMLDENADERQRIAELISTAVAHQ